METRANYALIGAFTLAVIAAGFLFVWWFTGAGKSTERRSYQVLFNGSVSGLSRGSSVLFNGLRVGEVTQIDLREEDPSQVAAIIMVSNRTPVKDDTRGRLEFAGLTGVASIALSGGSASAAELPPCGAKPGTQCTIVADRSDFQNLLENVQNLATKADSVLARADALFADNSGTIKQSIANVETFTKALADNSDGVNKFLAGMADLGDKIGPLASRLEALAGNVDGVVKAVDPQRVSRIVADVESVTNSIAANKGVIDSALKDFAQVMDGLPETRSKLDNLLALASGTLTAFDSKQIGEIVAKANDLMTTVETNRGSIDKALKDASQISAKLNASADKLDGVMTSVQGFFGDPNTKGKAGDMMKDIADAAKSIRRLSDNLDGRTKEITTGINRFTGPVAREYEALAVEGRRAIGDIGRAARSLENQPTQLLFGKKSAIPDYSPTR
jgi:phospholipid/cholesterol/gamma-HCH transport system substrate-binding protein